MLMQGTTSPMPKRNNLSEQVHQRVKQHVCSGDWVVDATCGNGHDTVMLAHGVTHLGHVYGFDIQQQALHNTAEKLEGNGLSNHTTLFHTSHEQILRHIPVERHGLISLVMFNLGYLPGANKQLTTQTASTISALECAYRLIKPAGVISIVAYPGHPAGLLETEQVTQWCIQQQRVGASITHTVPPAGKRRPPEWFWVKKAG
jgi:tRNA1(Val) A37 N6-methylase TrmN6